MEPSAFLVFLAMTLMLAVSVGLSTGSFSWACTTVVGVTTLAHVIRS